MDFDGLSLCFCFGRWCSLHVEFYDSNGTSVMVSVVLRSKDLATKVLGFCYTTASDPNVSIDSPTVLFSL